MLPRISFRSFVATVAAILVVGGAFWPYRVSAARVAAPRVLPDLPTFSMSVRNGAGNRLRGAYADGLFALPVEQQPSYGPEFVSTLDNTVTQFRLAAAFGNVGLLAHNFLSGQYFSQLWTGEPIYLVYGDGRIESYQVSHIFDYQATDPSRADSSFIDLDTLQPLSASGLFVKVYGGARHVTFQTCISEDGNSNWGRLFVIADPAPTATSAIRKQSSPAAVQ